MFDANADHGSGERLLTRLMRGVRLRGRRPGAVLAMVALSLVGLAGVVALAIDLGMLFSARAEAQRIADAAALAGASAFIDHDPATQAAEAYAAAEARAYEYAQRQSLLGEWVARSEVTPMIVMDSQKVRVRIRRETVPLFFARVFGIRLGTAHAVAAAEAVKAGSTSCIKPFAIPNMWNLQNQADDIYRRAGEAPIWDFDAHLTPNEAIRSTGRCTQQGQRWECPPEVWKFDGNYIPSEHGYESDYRNNAHDYKGNKYYRDAGRRVPLKINFPTTGPTSSFWFPWRMPGSSGVADFKEALKGCIDDRFNVGQVVETDGVETENGLFPKPTYDAIIELVNQDRDAVWVDEGVDENGHSIGHPYSPKYSNIQASPRVITVAVFNPANMQPGHNYMEFVDFATFFLEDPRVTYPNVNPAHHAPITGRLMKFTSGQAGPNEGNLIKRLRLVE